MNDVMLDLETMGNGPDAAIIAIGAVEFDLTTRQTGHGFYVHVDLDSAVQAGGVMDPATVLWWLRQSEAARAELARPGERIEVALHLFREWLTVRGPRKEVRVWGNGAAFDNVILASAYRRLHLDLPWEFWNDRCYRTIKAQHPGIKIERSGTHHSAIDDAISQANHLITMIGSPQVGADETAKPDTEVSHTGNTWSKTCALAELQQFEATHGPMADHLSDGGRY